MEKQCIKCGRILNISCYRFRKNKYENVCNFCVSEYNKNYKEKHKEELKLESKIWRNNNKDKIHKYNTSNERRKHIKEWTKQYNEKEEVKQRLKQYYQNPEVKQRIYNKEKEKLNVPSYRLEHNVLTLLGGCLAGRIKQSPSLEERCGYTVEQLRQHLESQFTPEMNWSNYGTYWELDHITPRFKFYYESYDDKQFKQCWALSNLRPLTIKENRERDKI